MNVPMQALAGEHGLRADWLAPADWPAWEAFLETQPERLIYHRAGWLRALAAAFPHMHGAILALRESEAGRIVGGTTLCEVRSALLGNRLVCVPFASFYDPLVQTRPEFDALAAALCARAQVLPARRVEIRTWRTAAAPILARGPGDYPFRHHWLGVTQGRDAIWEGLAPTSIRQRIARAQRSGLQVVRDQSAQGLAAFHGLLRDTRQRLHVPSLPLSFFEALSRELGWEHCRLHLAMKHDQCVGAFFGLVDGETYIFEYAADLPSWRKDGVNQLLYWTAIEEALQLGCRLFSLGRTAADQAGLIEYKRRWGTQEDALGVCVYPAAVAATRARPSTGRRWIGEALARAPVPLYQAMSNAIYRHWG